MCSSLATSASNARRSVRASAGLSVLVSLRSVVRIGGIGRVGIGGVDVRHGIGRVDGRRSGRALAGNFPGASNGQEMARGAGKVKGEEAGRGRPSA